MDASRQDEPTVCAPGMARAGGIIHAFLTRRGGVSGGIYDSLNCGFGSNDGREVVAENRRRALVYAGAEPESLLTLYQVHSAEAFHVKRAWSPDAAPRADAMVTDRPGLTLGILTADCAPVLLADPRAGVIGAAHAGWKGAVTGVVAAAIEAMETLGADRARMVAAVGPSIAQESYEVGPELRAAFLAQGEENARWFKPSSRAGHHRFDLPGYVAERLRGAGVGDVETTEADTCAEPDRFFSYRRATHRGEPDYGRQVSMIALMG